MADRFQNGRSIVQSFFLMVMTALLVAACQVHFSWGDAATTTPGGPMRILFVGNSLTYFNGGIDTHLQKLEPSLQTTSVSQPGYSWKNHWNSEETLKAIREGGWTYVILQDQSQLPVINPTFSEYFAERLDREIRQSGAETILMMTWERADSLDQGVTTANLANAYQALGQKLNAKVAPVGLAFGLSRQTWPELELAAADAHPNLYGTYLAACVLYGFILNRNPVGTPYRDPNISVDIAAYLQRRAAESLGYPDV